MGAVDAFASLRKAVDRHVGDAEGRQPTAIPGLWFFRATQPVGPKPVDARMVTLAIIVDGRKTIEVDDEWLVYEPGQHLLVTGERRYRARVDRARPQAPYRSISLEFAPALLTEALIVLNDAGVFLPRAANPTAVVAPVSAPVLDATNRIVAALNDPVSRRTIVPLVRRELLLHLLRTPAGATLRGAALWRDPRIVRAIRYLDASLDRRITVSDVARHVAMSPSHFAHRFRDVMRVSPMRYVKHQRLRRARSLMVDEGLGAAEAGLRVGYASASHFSRDFRGFFGASPAAYARRFG